MNKRKLLATYYSRSEQDTHRIGEEIYQRLTWPCCVYLQGELGAGKTTLCQSIIGSAGYRGAVTSPTYNLIQHYPVSVRLTDETINVPEILTSEAAAVGAKKKTIYHMDLYRLNDPQELYYLGLADLWSERSLFLIEWPEKGNGILQNPDYIVEITKKGMQTEELRKITLYQTF